MHDSSASRSIKDADEAGEVSLPAQGVQEPSFRRSARAACATTCCPATRSTWTGDTIPRPPGGAGGAGSEGSPDGEGEDDFRFALSREEFVDLFLEDLELPDLAKRKVVDAEALSWSRAGYSVVRLAGQPRAAAHHAQQPVAPHRAEAAEAGRDRQRCARRSPRWTHDERG